MTNEILTEEQLDAVSGGNLSQTNNDARMLYNYGFLDVCYSTSVCWCGYYEGSKFIERTRDEIIDDVSGAWSKAGIRGCWQTRTVTVLFPPDFVAARSTYWSTPLRLRLVIRKNSTSHNDFEFTNTP